LKNSRTLWLAAAVVGIAIMSSVMTAGAGMAMQARPTAVCVVDVNRVITALDEAPELDAELNTKRESIQSEINDRSGELKRLQEDLALLQEGSDAFNTRVEELRRKSYELQFYAKYEEAAMAQEKALLYEALYKKIVDSAGKAAQENGYDLVLYKDRPTSFAQGKDDKAIRALLGLRKVIWSSPELDLTDQVILRMNNEFKNNVN